MGTIERPATSPRRGEQRAAAATLPVAARLLLAVAAAVKRSRCAHTELVRRCNWRGEWLECVECGWESPGLELFDKDGRPVR